MSALNIILRAKAAYVVTDGMTSEGGLRASPRPKVLPLPNWTAALTARGYPPILTTLFAIMAHRRKDFEDAANHIGYDLRDTVTQMRTVIDLGDAQEVALVGWLPRADQFVVAFASAHDRDGSAPFETVWLSGLLGPDDGSLYRQLGGRDFIRGAKFDPSSDALRLIEVQSRMPGAGVGEFCQLTTITREATTMRVLGRTHVETGQPVSFLHSF